jgi:hypothetical protein
MRKAALFSIVSVAFVLSHSAAAFSQEKTRIKFASGNDNSGVEGSIKGSAYHDYVLSARSGQGMSVSLITKGSAFFNILPPGSTDVAIYNSSINGNDVTGLRLPTDGDYKIRVYLMGNDKDTNKMEKYMVSVSILPN